MTELTAEEVAGLKEQGMSDEEIAAAQQEKAPEAPAAGEGDQSEETPTETPDGSEEEVTSEERIARLEAEKEEWERASKGQISEIAKGRDRVRLAELETNQLRMNINSGGSAVGVETPPEESIDDEDYLTGSQVKTLLKKAEDKADQRSASMNWGISEQLGRIRHPDDFEAKMTVFNDLASKDPMLNRLMMLEPDPHEFMYRKAAEGSLSVEDAKTAGKREVVDKLTKTKPKFSSGGGGSSNPSKVTLDSVGNMTPEEFNRLPEADRARLLRESGG